MGTLAELKARIAEDLNRSDLTTTIATGITSAIERYAAKRFWFTEDTRTTTTVNGVSTAAAPDGLRIIDEAWVTISGTKVPLDLKPLTDVVDLLGSTTNVSGQPCIFAHSGDLFTIYRLPDAAYTITATGIYDLAALSAPEATNAWTTEAADLIANEVIARIRRIRLRDYDGASAAEMERDKALKAIRAETTRRLSTGVKPSR